MHPNAKADVFEGDSMIKMLHNKAASNLENCWVALFTATKDEQHEGDSTTIKTLCYKATSEECTETSYVSLDDKIIGHFITMVHIDRGLYELDGQKYGPVRHGGTTQDSLLEDECKVAEEFMKHDPDSWCFTIMALVPKKE